MCIKKLKLPYFGLSLLFLLSLSLSYLPGINLQQMSTEVLLMKLAQNSQEITTFQMQLEKKLKISTIALKEAKSEVNQLKMDLTKQKLDFLDLKKIQEELQNSTKKTMQSFVNFKEDIIREKEKLELTNNLLTVGIIVLTVVCVYNLVAPP